MRTKASHIALVLLSGTTTALSFPKFNLWVLAWVSLIPLFYVILKHRPKQAFFYGFLAGLAFNVLLIYWIPAVPAHYGNLSLPFSFLIYIVFVLFLALFWGLFCLFLSFISLSFPKSVFLVAPFLWVSSEYVLTHLFTGFPWGLLGASQFKNLMYIQIASATGIYGLSFFLVLFQSMSVFSLKHRKKWPVFTALGLIFLLHGLGLLSLRQMPSKESSFTASVIQGNVSSDIYWDQVTTQEIKNLFERHLDLSQRAYRDGAQLIIWPEFSVTLCFSCPQALYQEFKQRLFRFVQETGCTLLIGTNEIAFRGEKVLYYNTALCLSPDLSISQYYKMHLVPFGEYTPYKKIFAFIQSMTHAIGDITPGKEHTLHKFESYPFGSPICYEIIFPDLVRRFVKKGAQFLAAITNDGWYGNSSAPYQHFSMAVIRAVENRRYLLRAATTGISGIIDPCGRIISHSKMMTVTHLTADVSPSMKQTIYTRYGDILAFLSLTFSGAFLILAMTKRIHAKQKAHKRDRL